MVQVLAKSRKCINKLTNYASLRPSKFKFHCYLSLYYCNGYNASIFSMYSFLQQK